jgi:adenine-specific DNA-methyltransferase
VETGGLHCFDKHGAFIPAKLQEIVEQSGATLSKEGYSLNWLGKSYARLLANENVQTWLKADQTHNTDIGNCRSNNLLIKGDNLEVLKHLVGAYSEQVKMIYIDPPYNTGSDGFVYADNRKFTVEQLSSLAGIDEDEAKRILEFTQAKSNSHSAWLTFMYPRLYIARQLLRDDGVIFISIDDNEQAQLKLLCDEVFGEENFVADLIWRNGRTAASHFTIEHEYIICYANNKELLGLFEFDGNDVISDRTIKKIGEKNPASEIRFKKGIRFDGENKIYPKEFGSAEKIVITDGLLECRNGRLMHDVTIKAGWTMKNMIESWLDGEIVIDQKGQKITSFFFKNNGILQYEKEKGTIHPKSIIESITTKNGSSELFQIFGKKVFEYPKPVDLIKKFTTYLTKKTT